MKIHQTIKATLLLALALLASIGTVRAQNGTWTNNITPGVNRLDTVWSDTTNWLNGVVADGAGSSAFFNTIDIFSGGSNGTIFVTADVTNLVALTNGNMFFGDTVKTDGVGNWVLVDSGYPITLDGTASSNSIIDVDLAQGAANNLVTGWGTATINPNMNGTNTLVKSGPSSLILNPTAGNSFSGGMVISNGMVQLGTANQTGTANQNAPGTGPIIFRGGSLRMQNAAIPGNNPSNGGGGIPGLANPILVEGGMFGTLYTPPRSLPYLTSTATVNGGGTLTLIVDYVRGNLGGDWTGFTGRVAIASSTRATTGDLRIDSSAAGNFIATGWANNVVSFTNNGVNSATVNMQNQSPIGNNIHIGALEASIPGIVSVFSANTTVNVGGGNSAPFILTVGELNTDASFSGNFPAGAGSVGLIKVGTGNWTLNGPTVDYTGITVVSNGVMQFGSGTSGKIGRSAVVSNYSAVAFGRTDSLVVTNVIDGTGSLIQRGSGRTTLSPSTGANTYTGKTFITNGTLAVTAEAAFGVSPVAYVPDQVTLNGGSFAAATTQTLSDANRGISLGASGGGLGADGANTLTVSSTIAGSGNLTINNTGLVQLTGANTYTGKTIAKSGTLLLSSESPLGSAPGVATADQLTFDGGTLRSTATFAIDDANRGVTFAAAGGTISPDAATMLTISEPVAGVGSLTKSGAGTLVLNGAGTRTGSTLITQGTLAIGTSGSSASSLISIASGTTLDVSAAGLSLGSGQTLTGNGSVVGTLTAGSGSTISVGTSVGAMTMGGLSLGGGATNHVEISNTTNDTINVTGNLSLAGINTIQLDLLESLTAGTHTLIKYGGTLTSGGVANLVIAGYPLSRVVPTLVHNIGNKSIDLVLTGAPLSITWQGGLNGNAWDINTTANWVGPQTFYNGDAVTFDNTGAANSSVNLTTILSPGNITVNSTTDYTFGGSGKISAGTDLNKAGVNTLNVLTLNDNAGTTTISGGTVQVGNGSTSGSLGTGNIVNNAALSFNLPDSRTVPGLISGSGSLTVQGGTVVLTGQNSYNGGTVINASGTIEVGAGGGAGTLGTGAVTDNGALVYRRTGTVTNSGSIGGSGSLEVRSGGTVVLAANNSYAGASTVTSGTLQVGAGGLTGTLGTAGTVTATNGSTVAFNRSDDLTNSVTILGVNGQLAQMGSGTLVITNDANDYGNTLITNGKLQLGDGANASGRLGRGTVTITSPGTLALKRPDIYTLTNVVAGSGSVTVVSPARQNVTTLGVANTYAGGTTISNSYVELVPQATTPAVAGAQLVNGTGLGTGPVTFLGNSTLQLAWATNQDTDVAGVGNFPNAISVAAGQTANIYVPERFEFSGAVSGAGTVNYGVAYVRGNVSGSWSNFTGVLNVISNTVNTNAVHDFRVFNTNGFPKAKVHLADNASLYWRGTADSIVPIGEFSGDELTFFGGTGGAEGGNAVTWVIGGLNTDATFAGTSSSTVAVGIRKVGTGKQTFTGVNNYTGNTTVSNGSIALGISSTFLNGEIQGSAVITLAAPGTLDATGRSDGTFQLGAAAAQTLGGNGTVVGHLSVGGLGTLSPGFSIGTLTVSSNVSFAGGNYLVDINPAAGQTSDRVVAQNVDLNTAVITVTNLGNTLKTGDAFQIFQASGTIVGTPTSVTGGLPPGPGGTWDLSGLTVNGTIKAVLPPSPTLTNSISGGGTTLDFAWDAAYLGWRLYVQTNSLNVGLSTNWVPIVGTEGTTTLSAPIDTTTGSVFYRLAYP